MQPATDNRVISFKELKDSIRQSIWVSGEAENLVHAHNAMFIEGLAEIQKWVPGEATINCTVTRFNRTYHKCGMTVIPAPKGIVTRVYTIAEDNWQHPVFFAPRAWPDPEDWAETAARPVSAAAPWRRQAAGRLPVRRAVARPAARLVGRTGDRCGVPAAAYPVRTDLR